MRGFVAPIGGREQRGGAGRWRRYGMPFTFIAHQAPVVPLVLLWPRRFDGVALCVGSMAPDLAYVAAGTPWRVVSHSAWGLVWFCVPITVVACAMIRRVGPTVAAQLPARWRDAGARLVGPAPGLERTLISAWIGGASHVALDAFTHGNGFGVVWWPVLQMKVVTWFGPVAVYKLLQIPGSVVLAGLTVWGLRAVVRRRSAVSLPAATEASRRWFAAMVLVGAIGAVVVAWSLRAMGGLPALVIRAAVLWFVAIVAAALVVRVREES